MTQIDGVFNGPHYQKQPRPVANSSAVVAERFAEDNANLLRQHLSALPFAYAVDCVLGTNRLSFFENLEGLHWFIMA